MAQKHAPGRPLRKDAARNRERILAAARELFAERGLAATLNEIAHHAGVGVGTVYRHFPDREQLIDGLFEQRIDEFASLMRSALEDPDPWRGLTGFMEGNLALQAQDRGLQQLVLGASGGQERLAKARAKLRPLGAKLIKRAKDAGALREDVAPADLPALLFMLGSVIDLVHEIDPELWRRYLAIVLRGLRADAVAPDPLPVAAPPLPEIQAAMGSAWARRN